MLVCAAHKLEVTAIDGGFGEGGQYHCAVLLPLVLVSDPGLKLQPWMVAGLRR